MHKEKIITVGPAEPARDSTQALHALDSLKARMNALHSLQKKLLGDPCSIEELYKQKEMLVRHLISKGFQNGADVEEEVQHAFSVYYEKGMDRTITVQKQAYKWLWVVAHNSLISRYRKYNPERQNDNALLFAPEHEQQGFSTPVKEFLDDALAKLSEAERTMLRQIYFEKKKQRHIAEEINKHEGTVSRMRDASLLLLKKIYADAGLCDQVE